MPNTLEQITKRIERAHERLEREIDVAAKQATEGQMHQIMSMITRRPQGV